MQVGDLVFMEDKDWGHHRLWRIEAICLGAPGAEGLVRLMSLSHNAGTDEDGEKHLTTVVPAVLLRNAAVYTRVH